MAGHVVRSVVWGQGTQPSDTPSPLYMPAFRGLGFGIEVDGAESASVYVRVDFTAAKLAEGLPFVVCLVGEVAAYFPHQYWEEFPARYPAIDLAAVYRADPTPRFIALHVERPNAHRVHFMVLETDGYENADVPALVNASVRY